MEKSETRLKKENDDLLSSNTVLEKKNAELETEQKKLTANERKHIVEDKQQQKETKVLEKEVQSISTHNSALKKTNALVVKENKVVNQKREKEKEIFTIKIERGDSTNKKLKLTVEKGNKEAKIAKAIIKKKEHEIEKLNHELSNFEHIASHTLQEPLRKIQTMAALILEKEKKNLSKNGKNYFLHMVSSAQRIRDLIQELIDYSNSNSSYFKIENTNLNTILKEVKRDLEKVILQSRAKITSTKLHTLQFSPFKTRKIFKELILNSIKFSRPKIDPIIRIASMLVMGKDLKQSSLSKRKTYCHISFTDNGIGFEQKYCERIFQIFQKLDPDKYDGCGIGLAKCRKIIENYGGIITATGKVDKGATFDIYLPFKPIKK